MAKGKGKEGGGSEGKEDEERREGSRGRRKEQVKEEKITETQGKEGRGKDRGGMEKGKREGGEGSVPGESKGSVALKDDGGKKNRGGEYRREDGRGRRDGPGSGREPRTERVYAAVCFSKDGKKMLTSWASHVEVHSTLSGKKMFALEGHTRQVTGISLHPFNVSQAFTSSLDGSLRLWDVSDGTDLKVWSLPFPINSFVLSSDARLAYVAMVKEGEGAGKEGGKKSSGTVNVVDLETGRQKVKPLLPPSSSLLLPPPSFLVSYWSY
eukprot:236261-Hanusia_phi.AAC.1